MDQIINLWDGQYYCKVDNKLWGAANNDIMQKGFLFKNNGPFRSCHVYQLSIIYS